MLQYKLYCHQLVLLLLVLLVLLLIPLLLLLLLFLLLLHHLYDSILYVIYKDQMAVQ